MPEHPIETLIRTSMDSIKDMVDVNTILGDPVETTDGTVIIPVSRVSFGFVAGGSEFDEGGRSGESGGDDRRQKSNPEEKKDEGRGYPFGGGSGAGISLQPTAFLVVGGGEVRLLTVANGSVANRLIDVAPKIIDRIDSMLQGKREGGLKSF